MPIYTSDSEDSRPIRPRRLFGREKSLHTLLGGGRAADILLWKNKNLSAAVLSGFTIIWFLFEVVEYNFVTLLCHISIVMMLVLFVWSTGAGYWSPPNLRAIIVPESTFRWLYTKINRTMLKFYDVSTGKDLKTFFMVQYDLFARFVLIDIAKQTRVSLIFPRPILSGIGNYLSSLNLLYIGFVCLATLPALYERYQHEVDLLASQGNRDIRRMLRKFDSKVLNKIPRGPVKERKRF